MLKIINQPSGILEVKRLYLHELEMFIICPNCSYERKWDNYFYYPEINTPINIHCYCSECEHEWEENVILKINLELI